MRDNNEQTAVYCICGHTLTTLAPNNITLGFTATCDGCKKEWKIVQEHNRGRRKQRYVFDWSPEHTEGYLIGIQIILPFHLQRGATKHSQGDA